MTIWFVAVDNEQKIQSLIIAVTANFHLHMKMFSFCIYTVRKKTYSKIIIVLI